MKPFEFNFKTDLTFPNARDLAYFINLQESRPTEESEYAVKKWDKRADMWEKERINNRKGEERIISAVNYLEQRGILTPDSTMVDIGCGPGRFAAAFAPKVKNVLGLDISEKMIAYGKEHIKVTGITNVSLRACDFKALDIDKEGYRDAFDIVFSSMTPAIHSIDGLMKSMEMSRGWCCNITHLSGYNYLRTRIAEEVFGKKPSSGWTGLWFYSLFNVLFLMGYNPETSYYTLNKEIFTEPDREYAEFIAEHMLSAEENTSGNISKIHNWLKDHANADGMIKEVTSSCYGRILWNINDKTKRPDYRALGKGASL